MFKGRLLVLGSTVYLRLLYFGLGAENRDAGVCARDADVPASYLMKRFPGGNPVKQEGGARGGGPDPSQIGMDVGRG